MDAKDHRVRVRMLAGMKGMQYDNMYHKNEGDGPNVDQGYLSMTLHDAATCRCVYAEDPAVREKIKEYQEANGIKPKTTFEEGLAAGMVRPNSLSMVANSGTNNSDLANALTEMVMTYSSKPINLENVSQEEVKAALQAKENAEARANELEARLQAAIKQTAIINTGEGATSSGDARERAKEATHNANVGAGTNPTQHVVQQPEAPKEPETKSEEAKPAAPAAPVMQNL